MPDGSQQQPDPIDKSLGEQATGADASRRAREKSLEAHRKKSLGNQATRGDALSSVSDLSDLSGDPGDAISLVDLSERYEIQKELGKGGMGVVLRALDTRLKRPVAIKRVLGEMVRSKRALTRFLTEAQSIAALNHSNIVQIYDYGRDAEGPFIIMELVEGESLQEKLKAGKLEIEEAVDITCQLCDGLSTAHARGIIHRDIKPANILLTENGVPKLTDFGLARQQNTSHGQTSVGAIIGTIDFMAPEQQRDSRSVDERSDLWSLAATCFQMITGKSPKVIRERDIPSGFQDVLMKMLEERPADRYSSALEFKEALLECRQTTVSEIFEQMKSLFPNLGKNVSGDDPHTTATLGIETEGGVMTPIVPKGTPLPTEQKQTYSTADDNQAAVTVKVFRGESQMVQQNRLLGEFNLEGIPTAPRGVPQIEVTFSVDLNEQLSVSAKDLGTGKSIHVDSLGEDIPRTSASLGIETEGGVMAPIVPKGTPLPTEQKQTFSTADDNQAAVTVKVFRGERRLATLNRLLGEFNLEGIPTAPKGVPQIEVTFSVDLDEQLSVAAKDLKTGKSIHVDSLSVGEL